MNLMHHIVKIIWLFSIITFGLGNTLSLQENEEGTWNVNYESDSSIKRFEFVVDGDGVVVTGVSGGAAEEAGFSISSSSSTNIILGFSNSIINFAKGRSKLISKKSL